jgi:opacity protein-like surface antigen
MRKAIFAAAIVAGLCAHSFAGVGFMVNYSGVGPGFAGTVGLTSNLYLNLGASFSLNTLKPENASGTSDVAFSVPLWLSISLKKIGNITPYIPIGVAYSMGISSTEADDNTDPVTPKSSSTTISVGPYSGFGVEWAVNDNIGVWGECDLGYSYGMVTDKTDGAPDVKSTSHSVSLVQSGVGITYYF